MADTKTENLTAAGALARADKVHIVQSGNSRQTTLGAIADLAAVVGSAALNTYKGLFLSRTATQSFTTATTTAVAWQSKDKDTAAGKLTWSAGTPSRVVVGPGVTRIGARAGATWANNTSGDRMLIVRKNGATSPGEGYSTIRALAGTFSNTHQAVAYFDVVENDYIEAYGFQSSGGALTLNNSNTTYLEVWVEEVSA